MSNSTVLYAAVPYSSCKVQFENKLLRIRELKKSIVQAFFQSSEQSIVFFQVDTIFKACISYHDYFDIGFLLTPRVPRDKVEIYLSALEGTDAHVLIPFEGDQRTLMFVCWFYDTSFSSAAFNLICLYLF